MLKLHLSYSGLKKILEAHVVFVEFLTTIDLLNDSAIKYIFTF